MIVPIKVSVFAWHIKWFYRVSYHVFSQVAPIAEYTTHVPPYEEVIVEQQFARQVPDPLHIIDNIRCIMDIVMTYPDVFTHPLFADIMEGIQSEYNMIHMSRFF